MQPVVIRARRSGLGTIGANVSICCSMSYAAARSWRAVRVSGCSAPRIRSRSACTRSRSSSASFVRPGRFVGAGEVVACGECVGVLSAEDPLAVASTAHEARDMGTRRWTWALRR
jgi:hypothetical protein